MYTYKYVYNIYLIKTIYIYIYVGLFNGNNEMCQECDNYFYARCSL